jgi:hypothetical protein
VTVKLPPGEVFFGDNILSDSDWDPTTPHGTVPVVTSDDDNAPNTVSDVLRQLDTTDPVKVEALTRQPQWHDFSAVLRADVEAWLADHGHAVKAYNPAEPRNPHGEWADDGDVDTPADVDYSQLRSHVRGMHPGLVRRGLPRSNADLSRAHARDHHRFRGSHYHAGDNRGADQRPPGWYTGKDAVQIHPAPGNAAQHQQEVEAFRRQGPRTPLSTEQYQDFTDMTARYYTQRERPLVSDRAWGLAQKMVDPAGLTPAQADVVRVEVARNLDKTDDGLLDSIGRRWKVRVLHEMAPGEMGRTGPFGTGDEQPPWEMRLLGDLVTDPVTMNAVYDRDAGAGWNVSGATGDYRALQSVTAHEFGHTVMADAQLNAPLGSRDRGLIKRAMFTILFQGVTGEQHPREIDAADAIPSRISKYAATSPDETLAEAYAAAALHGKGADGTDAAARTGDALLKWALGVAARYQHHLPQEAAKALAEAIQGCNGYPASAAEAAARFGEDPAPDWVAEAVRSVNNEG